MQGEPVDWELRVVLFVGAAAGGAFLFVKYTFAPAIDYEWACNPVKAQNRVDSERLTAAS
jgi:hypothetical protein